MSTWPEVEVALSLLPDFVPPGADQAAGGCVAPMPGKVVKVHVAEGQDVSKGDALVVLEAMKMEQTLAAPADGTVQAIHVSEGDQVDGGQVLLIVE